MSGERPNLTPSEPWILTHSGRAVRLANPRPEDIYIPDIVHALSQLNRFTGHTQHPWTVAQHSVYCAMVCSPDLRLECLIHDFTEAYLGDVSSPLKSVLGAAYKDLERKHETAIRIALGLPEVSPETKARVKQVDWRAYEVDRELCMPKHDGETPGMPRIDYSPTPASKREKTEWRLLALYTTPQKIREIIMTGLRQELAKVLSAEAFCALGDLKVW
jgi:hypothetical protein